MPSLKLTATGDSTSTVIPDEMLIRLNVGDGDTLYAVETPEGYLLTAHEPSLDEQLTAGRQFMRQYHETFKVLAQ